MGQARKDRTFSDGVSPSSGVRKDTFYEMDETHIQEVFDLLTDRFGFPKEWQQRWKQHLANSPRGENEIALFLVWGRNNIEPILNDLLLRGSLHATFAKLCEHIVNRSKAKTKK